MFRLRDLNWWLILLAYTALALLSAGAVYTSTLANRGSVPYYIPLLMELTGYYSILALLPLMLLGFKWLPITRENWFWSVPVHLVLSIGFGVIHTLLMLVTRRFAYWVLNFGVYDYGDMSYRFLMEYHKQFLHYCIVYGVVRLLVYYRSSRERERERAALELRSSKLQRQLVDARMQVLRSQLNPHFLFNTLNMISSVMYEDPHRADTMIAALGKMLRYSLEQHPDPRVTVHRELEFVNTGLDLMRARFPETLKATVRCEPQTLNLLVPNMLLHTLVENAVKHHAGDRGVPIEVQAEIRRNGERLTLEVLDNGPGIADLPKAFSKGVGLANTRERLRALYGSEQRLELDNRTQGGLRVFVEIPAETATACVTR